MIQNIEQLKKERPDIVEKFSKMTKEELIDQCFQEARDALNMEERVSFFMAKFTKNMSHTTYTIESLELMTNEWLEDYCQDIKL